ncbi:hypothetical protein DFH09DRAFT_1073204 [Mycena vulgaris]|nr:hypothetical protein DFH09DRAFT_1073204 [Mycena vulgaris]
MTSPTRRGCPLGVPPQSYSRAMADSAASVPLTSLNYLQVQLLSMYVPMTRTIEERLQRQEEYMKLLKLEVLIVQESDDKATCGTSHCELKKDQEGNLAAMRFLDIGNECPQLSTSPASELSKTIHNQAIWKTSSKRR